MVVMLVPAIGNQPWKGLLGKGRMVRYFIRSGRSRRRGFTAETAELRLSIMPKDMVIRHSVPEVRHRLVLATHVWIRCLLVDECLLKASGSEFTPKPISVMPSA